MTQSTACGGGYFGGQQENWEVIKYFKKSEFACKHCGDNEINLKLVKMLDNARTFAKTSFRINSGYRCKYHNHKVGGAEDSAHIKGLAADISCMRGIKRLNIIKGLLKAGFERLIIYEDFIHVDIDKTKKNGVFTEKEIKSVDIF